MSHDLKRGAADPPTVKTGAQVRRDAASHERELKESADTETRLREIVAQAETLLRQKDDLIEHQQMLARESDHRLLNGLQLIVSLLSLQSRTAANPETAAQLAVAVNRVATIERVHRRLNSVGDAETVAFKDYLQSLCEDLSAMLGAFTLVAIVIMLVLVGVGIVMAVILAISAAFLTALGIISSSALIGIFRRRFSSGLRAFHYQLCAAIALPWGIGILWLGSALFHTDLTNRQILVIGSISGLCAGLLLAFAFDGIARSLYRRFVAPSTSA